MQRQDKKTEEKRRGTLKIQQQPNVMWPLFDFTQNS